jgi:beta-lactamase superfamily II metal-dependent hydrolase
MEAAWADDDGFEDALSEEGQAGLGTRLKAGDWKTDLVMRQLPLESRYFGMRAHALKGDGLMRDAIDTLYQVDEGRRHRDADGEFTERVADCCAQLEEASDAYEFAVNGFLTRDGQGMNAPYRSLLALLRLQAVLGQPSPEGAWETAFFWIQTVLRDVKQLEERQWASACQCELHLLQMLRPGDGDRRHGDIEARRAAVALERLDRQWVSPARQWLLVQLDAYIKFWGDKRFEATLRGFRGNERVSFGQGARNLMTTARAVSKLLDRPSLRARADGAKPPPALSVQKARQTAATLKPMTAAGTAVRADAQASGGHLGAKQTQPKAVSAVSTKAKATTARVKAGKAAQSNAYLRVDMLPARHGDCLWIEYGRGNGKTSRVLIDCGPKGSDDELRRRIDALAPEDREFELFILSHIDDDHIGAAITLLKDAKQLKLRFGDVWFNGWRHLSEHLNAAQGEAFSALLEREGLPWNTRVSGAAMLREVDALPEFTLPGGMKLTLLSPTPDRLKALARSWKREVGDLAGQAEAGLEYLGRVPSSSEDVDALAAMPFESDKTAPNGSSIAVLAEFGGHSLLLGADAHAPVLEEAVRLLCRQRDIETLQIDAFKLPHHGSQNNLSSTLLAQLRCPHYLVSTSGKRFNHPDREAIARVIVHGRQTGQPATLWFNYRAEEPLNAVWDKAALKAQYGYATVYPDDGAAFTRFALPAR